MGRQTVETFLHEGRTYEVDACWDEETPEGEIDFYELWELPLPSEKGFAAMCLTEGGDPFFEKPSRSDLLELIERAGVR